MQQIQVAINASDNTGKESKMKRESGTGTGLPPTVEAIFRGQSRITERGQITVPVEIRKRFGLRTGDILCFLEVDNSIVLKLGPLVLTE